jgi:aspartyl-tRNA(Asn)/glutamyl-tRNA(Gln) amidotransferase subunit B
LVEEMRARLPELPDARRDRFMSQYGLSWYDANLLTTSRAQADYFESCLKLFPEDSDSNRNAKTVANWLLGEFSRLFNLTGTEIDDCKVEPQHLVELFQLIEKGTLSTTMAKSVFEEMFHSGKRAPEIVKEKGLTQISAAPELEAIVDRVLLENAEAVADYKQGKEQALKFMVGQVMKATKGQANPQVVNELLRKKLGEGQPI